MSHVAKTALVTGASSGIGFATAKGLIEKGFEVEGVARSLGSVNPVSYTHLTLPTIYSV